MENTTTRVPAIRAELHTRAEAALTGWQCFDGPPATTTFEDKVLVIGHQGLTGGFSVEAEIERQQGLGHRLAEVFQISCILSAHDGNEQVFAELRATLDEALATLDAMLKADRALGGLCDLLSFGPSMNWAEESNKGGSTAEVLFSVVGRSLL